MKLNGICKSLKKGEAAAGLGLVGAMAISDVLGERMEIKWKAAKARDTLRGVLGELDGYLGDSHCTGEDTFSHPVSLVPTKLRAELFSTALQTPSPGSASRRTRLGEADPYLLWKGDGGLPPACRARHCPHTRHRRRSGAKRLPWILPSRPHLMLSSIPRHPRELAAWSGWDPSCNTGVPKAMRMPKALFPPPQTRPNLLATNASP